MGMNLSEGADAARVDGYARTPVNHPPTYVGMCHVLSESVEAFQTAFGPHAKEIRGDVKNYTDIAPVIQISEVVVG